jgi:hypothetical protein
MKEIRKTEIGTEVTTILLNRIPVGPYEFAVRHFMDGLITGDFSYFERDMDKDAKTFIYGKEPICGRAKVIEYWESWHNRYVTSKQVNYFEEVYSDYNSLPCLLIQNEWLFMFKLKDEKTVGVLSLPLTIGSRYSDTNMLNFRLDFDAIKSYLSPLNYNIDENGELISLENRMPCMWCDLESSKLTWYGAKMPAWSWGSNRWSLGQVSVCPKCGRVIEFCATTSETTDKEWNVSDEQSNCHNERNIYSDYAMDLCPKIMIDNLNEETVCDFMRHIESKLTDIKVDEGWHLKLFLADRNKGDDNSWLRVVDEDGLVSGNIRLHSTIEKTGMGPWQLYLLQRLYTVLPACGHGGYARRHYILKESDIDSIVPLRHHDLSSLREEGKLMPSVDITVNDDKLFAVIVNCCYWNDWKGLVRESVSYLTSTNKVHNKNERITERVLLRFHCGIYF